MKTETTKLDFASALFQRVEAFLAQPGRKTKGQIWLYEKALVILALYIWAYFQLLSSLTFSSFFGFAVLIGICHVLVPVNIVHDATHSVFSSTPGINRLGLLTMHLIGSNPFIYQEMHLKAHSDKESGSRRKAIETQQLLMKKNEKQSLPVVFYLFYAFYMIFVRDFVLVIQEKRSMSFRKWFFLVLPKAIYFTAIWVLPFVFVPLPAWQIFLGIFSIYLVITVLLIIILLMPTDPIEVAKEGKDQQISNSWVKEVLSHNVDFSPESQVLNFIGGGANMNVVHYLFTNISHIHYVGISKILRETAAEYQIPYRQQSVWKVFGIHWRYMMELGKG